MVLDVHGCERDLADRLRYRGHPQQGVSKPPSCLRGIDLAFVYSYLNYLVQASGVIDAFSPNGRAMAKSTAPLFEPPVSF